MFDNIAQLGSIPTVIAVLIVLLIGFKMGSYFAARKNKREMNLIDKERNHSSRSYKKLLDDENVALLSENERLQEYSAMVSDKISDYRKRLAGIGRFSFSSSRKRADVLYSLLLENEALEQLLTDLSKKKPDEKSDYLMHQMKDVQRKHQLMMKIFDDDEAIKHHVQNVLFNNEKTTIAENHHGVSDIAGRNLIDEKGSDSPGTIK